MKSRNLYFALIAIYCFSAASVLAQSSQGQGQGQSQSQGQGTPPVDTSAASALQGIQMLPPANCDSGAAGVFGIVAWDNHNTVRCMSGLTATDNGVAVGSSYPPSQLNVSAPTYFNTTTFFGQPVSVGTGTASMLPPAVPDSDFAINGNLVIGDHDANTIQSSDNSTNCDKEGMMRYNHTQNIFQGCIKVANNSTNPPTYTLVWQTLIGGRASCSLAGTGDYWGSGTSPGELYYLPPGYYGLGVGAAGSADGAFPGTVADGILATELSSCNLFQCDNGTWDATEINTQQQLSPSWAGSAHCTLAGPGQPGCTPGHDCD